MNERDPDSWRDLEHDDPAEFDRHLRVFRLIAETTDNLQAEIAIKLLESPAFKKGFDKQLPPISRERVMPSECIESLTNLVISVRFLYKQSRQKVTYLPQDVGKLTQWVDQAERLIRQLQEDEAKEVKGTQPPV